MRDPGGDLSAKLREGSAHPAEGWDFGSIVSPPGAGQPASSPGTRNDGAPEGYIRRLLFIEKKKKKKKKKEQREEQSK